jgi:hypothetical protein
MKRRRREDSALVFFKSDLHKQFPEHLENFLKRLLISLLAIRRSLGTISAIVLFALQNF